MKFPESLFFGKLHWKNSSFLSPFLSDFGLSLVWPQTDLHPRTRTAGGPQNDGPWKRQLPLVNGNFSYLCSCRFLGCTCRQPWPYTTPIGWGFFEENISKMTLSPTCPASAFCSSLLVTKNHMANWKKRFCMLKVNQKWWSKMLNWSKKQPLWSQKSFKMSDPQNNFTVKWMFSFWWLIWKTDLNLQLLKFTRFLYGVQGYKMILEIQHSWKLASPNRKVVFQQAFIIGELNSGV